MPQADVRLESDGRSGQDAGEDREAEHDTSKPSTTSPA
jgi:hypothetical protein